MRGWAGTVSNRGDDLCPGRTVATPWGRNKVGLSEHYDYAPISGWARATNSVDLRGDTGLLYMAPPCYLNRVIYEYSTPAGRLFLRRFAYQSASSGPGPDSTARRCRG